MKIDWQQVLEALKLDLVTLIADLIAIALIVIFARIALSVLSRLTERAIRRAENPSSRRGEDYAKSVKTGMTLLHSLGRYAIYFTAACAIANQLGFGNALSNAVTAAGVGVLAISFGAQSIIKDVVAGLFIMFERQYAVGDYVKINDYEGTVTSMAMRCTYLSTWKGEKIIIPNGQITTVINYSGEFNMAIIDVPIPYEEDIDRVKKILEEVSNEYYEKHKDICYGKPSVMGVQSFDDSSMKFTIIMKAVKRNHYTIQRELRNDVKRRLDEEGISIPYNQIVVHEEEKA